MVPVGGTGERLESMIKGEHVGAVLNPPFVSRATEAGLKVLNTGGDVLDNYPGNTLAASRAWAAENRAELVAFIRGFLKGLAFLRDPANRAEAVDYGKPGKQLTDPMKYIDLTFYEEAMYSL